MAHSRFDDALFAQAGACNPVALANALVTHLKAAKEEGNGTDAARRDPACRLIAHQLAHLMGIEFGFPGNEHEECVQACIARASPSVVEACGAKVSYPLPAPAAG
jgi:hypothetical protein